VVLLFSPNAGVAPARRGVCLGFFPRTSEAVAAERRLRGVRGRRASLERVELQSRVLTARKPSQGAAFSGDYCEEHK